MSLFTCYESDSDKEFDILMLESQIEVKKSILDFYKESTMYVLEAGDVTVPTPTQGNSKFMNVIERIINAIKRVIDSVIEMVKNIFTGKENMTPEDYFGSETGQIRFSCDIQKLEAEVDKEILKGRRMIQTLSSVTGISDSAIASFVDGSANILKRVAPVMIPAVSAWAISKLTHDKLSKKKKELDALKEEAEKNADTPEKQSKCVKIFSGIDKLFTAYMGVSKEYAREIRKRKRTKRK